MAGIRRALTAAAAALLIAGLAPASASADLRWSKAETLSSPGFPGTVAIDARGDVLAVWRRIVSGSQTRTFYAWRAPRGDWTNAREFESARGEVAVSVTPLGRATAAWNDGSGWVVSAEARPGTAFSEPRQVASGLATGIVPALATDDAGNAVIAWSFDTMSKRQNAGSTIFVSTRRAGGEWSDPQDVSGDVAGGGPFVATNPAGAAVVGWTTVENGLPEVSYRQPAGSFGPPERVPIEGPFFPMQLALDDDGATYLATPTSVFSNRPVRTALAKRSPLGGWSDPLELDTGGAPASMLVAQDGTVHLLMDNLDDRQHPKVQLATRRPDGTVVGPITVANDRTGSTAAMNLRGDIVAAWDHTIDFSNYGRIEAAAKPAGLPTFGPALPISERNSVEPRVALNDAGQSAIAWSRGGYTKPEFQVAVRDDPKLPLLPFPPTVDIDFPGVPVLDEDGDLVVDVSCTTDCKAIPTGVLVPGGGERLIAGRGSSRRLKARRRARMTVDLGAAGAEAVGEAIRAGRRPTVHVSVRARGKSPRPVTFSRRVRVR